MVAATKVRAVDNIMPGVGNPNGVAIILDYPNKMNWARKTHLQGEENRLLEATFRAIGLDLDPLWITYAVPYPVDKKASEADLTIGHEHLMNELRQIHPTKILVMGGIAHAALYGEHKPANVRQVRGRGGQIQLYEDESVYTVTTYPCYMVLSDPELFKDFSYDIDKMKRKGAIEPLPKIKQLVVENAQQLKKGLEVISAASAVACDTETSGLLPWEDEIEAIGFGAVSKDHTSATTVIVPYMLMNDDAVKDVIYDFMMGKTFKGKVVFHNAKFDLQFLERWLGKSLLDSNVTDTLLINYLLDERPIASASSPHGLKTISRIRYDAPDYKFDFERFWEVAKDRRNWAALHKYLSLDLYYTARLYFDLMQELDDEGPKLSNVLNNLLVPGVKSLAQIELRGVKVDIPYLEELGSSLRNDLERLSSGIRSLGEKMGSYTAVHLNPSSPKQLAQMLWDEIGLPAPFDRSTSEPVLSELIFKLKGRRPDAVELMEQILEYRGIAKLIGTYVDGLIEAADRNHRVHGQFNLAGTATGRLSSSNPNLQNIPQIKGPEIRRAFIAEEGWVFGKVDYSNLEYRTGAYLCQDSRMIQAFVDKRDIHTEVASAALGIPPDQVNKLQRYAAKFIGFGILYGRGAYTIANGPELRGHNWTEEDAQNFIDRFLDGFPDLRNWMNNQKSMVSRYHELESPLGRKRRYPFLTEKGLAEARRQALNFPIQSLASDFTLSSAIKLHRILDPREARILMLVHDEIDFEIREDCVDKIIPIILEEMTTNLPVDFNVPLVAEADVGPNWATLERWEPK